MGNELAEFRTNKLVSAGTQRASVHVAKMFAMLASPKKGLSAQALATGYIEAVSKYPEWAIQTAVEKFIGGRYPDHTSEFVPKSSKFAQAVIAEIGVMSKDAKDQQALTDQRERLADWKQSQAAKTPETRAKVRAALVTWKEQYAEAQAEEKEKVIGPHMSEAERTAKRFRPEALANSRIGMDNRPEIIEGE